MSKTNAMATKVPHLPLHEKARIYKRLMLVFLVVYILEGVASFSIGVWLLARFHVVSNCFINYQISAASSLILVSGVLTICVCSFGVVSTSKAENTQCLRPFLIFLVLLVALELSAAIVSTIDQHKLDDKTFHNSMSTTHWSISNENDEEEQKEELECWTEVQKRFRCCGVDGYRDWISDTSDTYNFSQSISTLALDSCRCELNWREKERKCIEVNVTLGTNVSNYGVFASPCHDALYSAITTQTTLIRWFCPILVILQVVAFAFIFWFFSKVQKANAVEVYGVGNRKSTTDPEPPIIFSVSNDRRSSS
ncbi:tetraspanin-4-like [Mizuhopecten yessoensis]|uniref:Tetraspanin n=1 Tax=Mizuhopecten yessoensis TaxID=6573 RepID=A0A210Q270_MIZYE|nr:tetraspanin-4-like [Mizuhopecten yessoensis]OWF42831.1 Tetraspanin-6 [Mizuhopecten yessoensis]